MPIVLGALSRQAKSEILYPFSSATFSPGAATGRFGPTLAQAVAGLTGTEVDVWKNNTSFFNTSNGIQLWTVPKTGYYTIESWGAAGGRGNGTSLGGLGARVKGTFVLISGQIIRILVGQAGSSITTASISDGVSGGGGGGSFVIEGFSGTLDSQVLVIASGGGGGNDQRYQNNRLDGIDGDGITVGGTGTATLNGGSYRGAATFIERGAAFQNGGTGGTFTRSTQVSNGGFGGGGSEDDARTGGGGWQGGTPTAAALSRNNGTDQSNSSGVRSGSGQVTITLL